MGRPRWMMIVPDDQGELRCDEAGHLYVAQPYNSAGCARLRGEIPVYSHRATGKKKIFDDAVDGGRGLMGELVLMAQPKTAEEQYREHLAKQAPELLPENIAKVEDEEDRSLTYAREEVERLEYERARRQTDRVSDGGFADFADQVINDFETDGFREL
jgi:hypothetical protein